MSWSPSELHQIGEDRLAPLFSGDDRLEALIDLIDGAQTSVRILYYIYAEDESGVRVRDALIAACARGAEVSVIIDGFGAAASATFFEPLEAAGADVCRFLPRFGRRYLVRNHQKLALADEARAIIGGFNVENEYFGRGEACRDLGLRIEGPAATRLAPYFDVLAAWTRDRKARVRTLRHALKQHSEHQGPVRWVMGGPSRRLSPWALAVRSDMAKARRLDMIAGYFAPNPGNLRRVERIVRRNGGRVRIVTAARSDNQATIGAARHTYTRLLKRGVRIGEYQPAKLHTKLYLVDDAVHLGSANFDMRSLYLNLELMVRVEDAGFARRMRDYFESEWADCHEVTREAHSRAGLLLRMKWAAAYYVVAVLDYAVTRKLNFGFD